MYIVRVVFSTYFALNEDNCTETRQGRGTSGTMSGAQHARHRRKEERTGEKKMTKKGERRNKRAKFYFVPMSSLRWLLSITEKVRD